MPPLLLLLLLLLPAALAGPIVVLPPSERASVWAEPLELAGLEPGPGGEGPRVIVEERGHEWVVVAIAGDRVRTVRVQRPATPREREELAHLAASMAAALQRDAVPSLPPPPDPSTSTSTSTTTTETRPASPPPTPLEPEPEPLPEPQPPPASAPEPVVIELPGEPEPLERPGPDLPTRTGPPLVTRLGLDLGWGGGAAPRGGVRVLTGPRLGSVDLLLGAETSSQADMDWLGAGRSLQSWRLLVGSWWVPGRVEVGAQVGVDLRYFSAATDAALAWVPFAGLEAGLALDLAERLQVVPHVRARRDLASLPLEVGAYEAVLQPGWWGAAGVELRVRTGQP